MFSQTAFKKSFTTKVWLMFLQKTETKEKWFDNLRIGCTFQFIDYNGFAKK